MRWWYLVFVQLRGRRGEGGKEEGRWAQLSGGMVEVRVTLKTHEHHEVVEARVANAPSNTTGCAWTAPSVMPG